MKLQLKELQKNRAAPRRTSPCGLEKAADSWDKIKEITEKEKRAQDSVRKKHSTKRKYGNARRGNHTVAAGCHLLIKIEV